MSDPLSLNSTVALCRAGAEEASAPDPGAATSFLGFEDSADIHKDTGWPSSFALRRAKRNLLSYGSDLALDLAANPEKPF